MMRFRAAFSGTANNMGVIINTAGVTLTESENFLGIYDTGQTVPGSATLLAKSADQSTNWQSTGYGGAIGGPTPLTSAATLVGGGDYFAAILANGTTIPAIAMGNSLSAGSNLMVNQGLSGLGLRSARYVTTGQTALPTAITAANVTNASDGVFPVLTVLP
jgi:hypothetical protein